MKTNSQEKFDETLSLNEDEPGSSVDHVTTLIRQAIVQGRYGPGERIRIVEVARQLGTSPMPVREALRKLEGEGIVSITPNRGATVKAVDQKFIEDIFEVRTTLELMILERCIDGMTLTKVKNLESILAAHQQASKRNDQKALMESVSAFNITLFQYGGNQEAVRIFSREWDTIRALRLRFGYSLSRVQEMQEELIMLIEALKTHDIVKARTVIKMHNRAGMEDLLARLALSQTHLKPEIEES